MNLRWISNPTRNRRCIVLASLALAYRFVIDWSTCSVEMSGQVAKWYVLSSNTTNVKLLTQQVAFSYRYMCSSIHIAILPNTHTIPSTRHAWTFVKWKKQNENNWNDSFQLDESRVQSSICRIEVWVESTWKLIRSNAFQVSPCCHSSIRNRDTEPIQSGTWLLFYLFFPFRYRHRLRLEGKCWASMT